MSTINWLLDPNGCPGFIKSQLVADTRRGESIVYTEYLKMKIPSRYALVNISDLVSGVVERSGVVDGLCFVSAMHITAGIYVNDAERGLLSDISKWIEELAPFGKNYLHHLTGEDNADAHLKSFLTNHSITVPITNGEFDFGTWQQIFYAEYDGLREKRVLVKIMGLS